MADVELVELVGVPAFTPLGWVRYPPLAEYDPHHWAHGIFTALAITLAEPLRKALTEHADRCLPCADMARPYCPEGRRLYDLLPAGDRIEIA
jgi:hypothetical protein